jgi:hypothetical protein
MKSVPSLLFFKPMKEEPRVDPDGTIVFPWATFFANGLVHTWDNNGVGGENWDSKDYPGENKYVQALARTPYKNPAPYRPGEKCYVREAWKHIGNECHPGTTVQACVVYRDGETKLCGSWPDFIKAPGRKWWNSGKVVWFSPVQMPQWAARRFVTVLSCEPVQREDGTWAWRVVSEEEK